MLASATSNGVILRGQDQPNQLGLIGLGNGSIFFNLEKKILKKYYFQELLRLFVTEEERSARRERRATVPFTVENFTNWAAENLHSPRSVWLFSMGFSLGTVFVVLRAAIR